MMKKKHSESRSPAYYVRKRLMQNRLAMIGFIIIILSIITAVLGYLIMPDQTPDANDGAVQIRKKPPGFEVDFIKIRKNTIIAERSIVQKMLHGQESEYILIPVRDYRIEGMKVIANLYGKENYIRSYNLLNAVKPLSVEHRSEIDKIPTFGDIVYLDITGKTKHIKYKKLIRQFEEKNVEHRKYLLGTDRSGRDLMSRLIFGTRISMSIGFIAMLISIFLGMTLGSIAGFYGGRIDAFIVWFMSVVWSIPGIMLVISISMALQSRGVWVAFVAVGLTMWVEVARVVRGQILAMKEKLFVEAARAFGFSSFRIVFYHILPNIMGPLIVIATANFASAIILEAGLSFLGLSVQPPTPSWGAMIFEGFQAIGTRDGWHLILFPGLAICIMVFTFNLFGNGLRDANDPKTLLN